MMTTSEFYHSLVFLLIEIQFNKAIKWSIKLLSFIRILESQPEPNNRPQVPHPVPKQGQVHCTYS